MKEALLTLIIFGLLTSEELCQQKSFPTFARYPASVSSIANPATVQISSHRARVFRTMLRENAKNGVNFSGHYIAATWGCGSACWSFAIIDAKTGRVFFIPFLLSVGGFGYSQKDLIQFRKNSRLLVVVGSPNDSDYVGRYFYVWRHNRLRMIRAFKDKEF